MITSIINTCLGVSVSLNYVLHVFQKGRGAATATLESKLDQHMMGICHEPLLLVFLGVKNTYNSLDRSRFMGILSRYRLSTKL